MAFYDIFTHAVMHKNPNFITIIGITIIIIVIAMSWIHSKVSFTLLRSALLSLRGSHYTQRAPLNITGNNIEIDKELALLKLFIILCHKHNLLLLLL